MNSSTSSSDLSPAWGRCLIAALGALAAGALLILALVVAVDPYDSGKLGLLGIKGVSDPNPVTADVSRARDGQFDSAIFGNSTGQLINPAELTRTTAKHFVQLVTPGADPRGQLAVLDFFARHHQRIGALVVVLDDLWCASTLPPLPRNSFPFWLYDDGLLHHLANLFTWPALDRAFRRIKIGLGLRKPTPADGFWSYEEVWPPGKQPIVKEPEKAPPFAGSVTFDFPFAEMLDGAIKRLPDDVPVILLMPPTFYTIVPQPGSAAAAQRRDCKAAYRTIVADRAHSNLLDYRVDNALTRDPANFVDLIHYRAKIASKLEEGIVSSLRLGEAAKIDF